MSQTVPLINTLKRQLKARGITYSQVAEHLDLSENSIKRLFADKKISLRRLEQICELAGMDLAELVQKMQEDSQQMEMLSEQQEQEFAQDEKLLLVAICALNHWRFKEILDAYYLEEPELIQLLAKLDRIKFIQLLPLNHFRLCVAKNFHWRPKGPIQKYFQQHVQADFFESSFTDKGEKMVFVNGMLSRTSNAALMKKITRLVTEFNDLHAEDEGLALEERFGSSLMVAFRHWEFGAFKKLRKNPDEKVF